MCRMINDFAAAHASASTRAPAAARAPSATSDVSVNLVGRRAMSTPARLPSRGRDCSTHYLPNDHVTDAMFALTADRLRELCVSRGLPSSGNKTQLVITLRSFHGILRKY